MKQQKPSALPQIELSGSARVVIGDCDGILEYEPETIKVRAGKRYVRVCGTGLTLCDLSDNAVLIRGNVVSLEFEG